MLLNRQQQQKQQQKARGTILYAGPSMLDGKPIVAIATHESNNEKIGDMIQTWILRQDVTPLRAVQSGADVSVCGQCPHRGPRADGGNGKRTCYVNVGQAPEAVWKAWTRGVYVHGPLPVWKPVRVGSYGDPAAVPFEVWEPLLANDAPRRTGYTHQWRAADDRLRSLVMASCDSPSEAMEAARAGWRTFLVRTTDYAESLDAPPLRSLECLSESKGLDCAACAACDGASARSTRAHIWIRAHGTSKAFVGGAS